MRVANTNFGVSAKKDMPPIGGQNTLLGDIVVNENRDMVFCLFAGEVNQTEEGLKPQRFNLLPSMFHPYITIVDTLCKECETPRAYNSTEKIVLEKDIDNDFLFYDNNTNSLQYIKT